MSNLIINCPHCDRPTPVELGKRVTSKQRCKHCKLFVGESDIVVGGRKPVVRKKVNVGGGQFGGERNLDDVAEQGGTTQPQRRILLSHVIVTLVFVAVGLGGVGFLLYKNYVGKKLAHAAMMDRFTEVKRQIEENEAQDFAPKRNQSTMPNARAVSQAASNLEAIMDCETPEELLNYVRNPENVKDRLMEYYNSGRGTLPIRDWLVFQSDSRIDFDEELKIAIFYLFKDDGEPWWAVFKEGYDLKLDLAKTTEELDTSGRSHVSIALVNGNLHIRIFNADGEMVVDKTEDALAGSQALVDLKKRLKSMYLPISAGLSEEETKDLIHEATQLSNYTLDEPINDPKLDWESFVRYSEVEVTEFLKDKPTEPKEFRVLAMIDDYFNYEYSDPREYVCVRLFDPTESFMFYGYAKNDSAIGRTIREQVPPKIVKLENLSVSEGDTASRIDGIKSVQADLPGLRKPRSLVTIKLKFPSPLQGDNQVEIFEFVRRSWYIP